MDENMLSRAGFSMLGFEPVTNTPGRVRGPHQGMPTNMADVAKRPGAARQAAADRG